MAALNRLSALLSGLFFGLGAAAPFPALGFSFTGVSNRIITPNGDHRNDEAVFRFTNPRDASGTLRIYDRLGHEAASIDIPAGAVSAAWDGRSGGQAAPSGVYVYVLTVEETTVSGTVVVIR